MALLMISLKNRRDPLIRGALVSVLLASAVSTSAQVFSPPKNLPNGRSVQTLVDPTGNINVLTAVGGDVFFSRSTDGGTTFSTPQNLSNDSQAHMPQILVDSSGNVNVAWEDGGTSSGGAALLLSRSTDAGMTFSPPVVAGSNVNNSARFSLVIDSRGNIDLAWEGPYSGSDAIFFSQSKDGGATFSAPVRASTVIALVGPLEMAVDSSGNIDLVWAAFRDVFFARSSDGGTTFSTPIRFGNISEAIPNPQLALDSKGNINVVYATVFPAIVFFERSNDGGATFSQTRLASSIDGDICCEPTAPQIAIDSGDIVSVVWLGSSSSRFATDVFFTRSSNGGATFTTNKNISNMGTVGEGPGIAVDGAGNINLVWGSGGDIFFSRSTDGGGTFSFPQNLSNNGQAQAPLQIGVDSRGNITAAWVGPYPDFFAYFSRGVFLSSMSLEPSTVTGGNPSTGTVNLSGPTDMDVTVDLSSSEVSVAVAPSSVSVQAGSNGASFTVATAPVRALRSVTISGSDGREGQSATLTVLPQYKAFVQPPINADGSSVFSAQRGVVPVKFMLTQNDVPTCDLPPATIAVKRTTRRTVGSIDESTYLMAADNGSNFRIDPTACQYVYNLAASSLGAGTYRVDISILGIMVGHAVFALN